MDGDPTMSLEAVIIEPSAGDLLRPHLPTRLVAVMFTDLVNSTGLKSRLTAAAYIDTLARHDRALRKAIQIANGRLQQDTGDGGFAIFVTASDATRAALLFQWLMRCDAKSKNHTEQVESRVGIHLGEVATAEVEFQQEGGAKVVGLTVDLAARIMSLAEPGQILLTRDAFNNARQFVDSHPATPDGSPAPGIQWLAHGPYAFKGNDDPLEVFEVGAQGIAPLIAPADSEKVKRFLAPGEEQTLGWRPAVGRPMENQPNWRISHKLGEGGFGEVWLAEQVKTGARRVYKFCFDVERLRAMKREVVLFRLLKDALGSRPDIATIRDWQFDQAPYYIELEHLPNGNLLQWVEAQGGMTKIPLKRRLEIVQKIAEALAAAHSIGILHKDIKPSNVLMDNDPAGGAHPLLTDFGIGMLTDKSRLVAHNITAMTTFEKSIVGSSESSRTGTRMYSPPESLVNKPYTIQGDIYSLGVMLYQMVAGDLSQPLGIGWERDVSDDLLREDIAAAVERDPARRMTSGTELAKRLATLEQRRSARDKAARDAADTQAAKERAIQLHQIAARRKKLLILASCLVVVLAGVVSWILALQYKLQVEKDRALASERQAKAQQRLAETAQRDTDEAITAFVSVFKPAQSDSSLTVLQAVTNAEQHLDESLHSAEVKDRVRVALGKTLNELQQFDAAEKVLSRASPERLALNGKRDLVTADLLEQMGVAISSHDQYRRPEEVLGYFTRAIDIRKKFQPVDSAEIQELQITVAGMQAFERSTEQGEDNFLITLIPYYENLPLPDLKAYLYSQLGRAKYLARHGQTESAVGIIRSMISPIIDNPKVRAAVPEQMRQFGDGVGMVGYLMLRRGDVLAAELFGRAAVNIAAELNGPEDPHYALVMSVLGMQLVQYEPKDKGDEGIEFLKKAVDIARRKIGPTSDATIEYTTERIASLRFFDRNDQADTVLNSLLGDVTDKSVAGLKMKAEIFSRLSYYLLGNPNVRPKDAALAQRYVEQAVEFAKRARFLPDQAGDFISMNLILEAALRTQGKLGEAEQISRQMLDISTKRFGRDHRLTGAVLNRLGLDLALQQKYPQAVETLSQAYKVVDESENDGDLIVACLLNLANAQAKAGNTTEADNDYRTYLQRCEELLGPVSVSTLEAMSTLAEQLAGLGRSPADRTEARRIFAQALNRSIMVSGTEGDETLKIWNAAKACGFDLTLNPTTAPVRNQ